MWEEEGGRMDMNIWVTCLIGNIHIYMYSLPSSSHTRPSQFNIGILSFAMNPLSALIVVNINYHSYFAVLSCCSFLYLPVINPRCFF